MTINTPSPENAPASTRQQKPRHFPRAGLIYWVAFLRVVSALTFGVFIFYFVRLLQTRHAPFGYVALAALAGFAILSVYCFFKSRNLRCNLCHGTVLMTNSSHRHRDARKLPLVGYKWTVVLDVLFRRAFRCIHCGSLFRLKK